MSGATNSTLAVDWSHGCAEAPRSDAAAGGAFAGCARGERGHFVDLRLGRARSRAHRPGSISRDPGLEEAGKAIAVHERRVVMGYAPEGETFRCDQLGELWASHGKNLETVQRFLVDEPYWFDTQPPVPARTPAVSARSSRGHGVTTDPSSATSTSTSARPARSWPQPTSQTGPPSARSSSTFTKSAGNCDSVSTSRQVPGRERSRCVGDDGRRPRLARPR